MSLFKKKGRFSHNCLGRKEGKEETILLLSDITAKKGKRGEIQSNSYLKRSNGEGRMRVIQI